MSFLSSHTIPRHIICNFRSLFYFIYFSVNSWYLNKPDEDCYLPVKILQLNPISRCLISPCKSLLDCNVFNLIYFDWSRSFLIRRWARLIVHGFFIFFLPYFALGKCFEVNFKRHQTWSTCMIRGGPRTPRRCGTIVQRPVKYILPRLATSEAQSIIKVTGY